MAYCEILNPDLIPTFWRVGSKIVVGLWRRWPHGTPRDEQMMPSWDVVDRIQTPSEPWNKEVPPVRFARGEDLSTAAAGHIFLDMGSVTMDFSRGLRVRENWSINVLHTGHLSQGVERFLETLTTKMSRKHISAVQGRQQVLMVTSKFGSTDLDDDVYMLFSIGPFGCVTNMDLGSQLPREDMEESSRTLLPTLRLTGPNDVVPDETRFYQVTLIDPATDAPYPLVDKRIEIHVEATAGYLPKRRVTLVNGYGTFPLQTAGLSRDDEIKVKAGFWNYTGAAEKITRVV